MEPWQKEVIKQNFNNAIRSLEHTINELGPVINKLHLGSMQNVVDEYEQLLEVLEEV